MTTVPGWAVEYGCDTDQHRGSGGGPGGNADPRRRWHLYQRGGAGLEEDAGVEQQIHLLPARKDAKIVHYCMSDRMSTIASETLVRLGYTNVWNLVGGMVDWSQQGYPLISAPAK